MVFTPFQNGISAFCQALAAGVYVEGVSRHGQFLFRFAFFFIGAFCLHTPTYTPHTHTTLHTTHHTTHANQIFTVALPFCANCNFFCACAQMGNGCNIHVSSYEGEHHPFSRIFLNPWSFYLAPSGLLDDEKFAEISRECSRRFRDRQNLQMEEISRSVPSDVEESDQITCPH